MDYIQAFVLAFVQGVTEWLPISSSGHLAVLQILFGINAPVAFDVALHFGTLLAVLVFMRDELRKIIMSFLKFDFKTNEGRTALYTVVASIPIAIIGLIFKNSLKSLFTNLPAITLAFFFTGLLLLLSNREVKPKKLDYKNSFIVGVMQAVSIIPGVSRSGSTITVGLLLGINREDAARFSFLLSIPAIGGATILEAGSLIHSTIHPVLILSSVAVSAVVGYMSLKLLWKTILTRRFYLFSIYCFTLGLVLSLIQILR